MTPAVRYRVYKVRGGWVVNRLVNGRWDNVYSNPFRSWRAAADFAFRRAYTPVGFALMA